MTERARGILEQLRGQAPWQTVEAWVEAAATEGLDLEFKGPNDPSTPAAYNFDSAARAVAALANTEGGLLVLGVDASSSSKHELDSVKRIVPIPDVELFAQKLGNSLLNRVHPKIPGVALEAVVKPGTAGGVVAVHVPSSIAKPHEVLSLKGRFFMRSNDSSTVMPHSMVESLFSATPPPVLRLAITWKNPECAYFTVRNVGRGFAENIGVRLHWSVAGQPTGFNIGGDRPHGWWHAPNSIGNEWHHFFTAESGRLLYPNDELLVESFQRPGIDITRVDVRARLDARHMQPFELKFRMPIPGDDLVLPSGD